jgi:FAD-dependent sensor of blue light
MQESLIHLIYASRASPQFSEQGIPALLEKARLNNSQHAVTGMLLYIDGSFFQVVEGPRDTVAALFKRIGADPRHQLVTHIISEPISRRSFGDWTMGYQAISLSQAGSLTGENDFFNDASCLTVLDPGRAKKLLRAFKDGSWRVDQTAKVKVVPH